MTLSIPAKKTRAGDPYDVYELAPVKPCVRPLTPRQDGGWLQVWSVASTHDRLGV